MTREQRHSGPRFASVYVCPRVVAGCRSPGANRGEKMAGSARDGVVARLGSVCAGPEDATANPSFDGGAREA